MMNVTNIPLICLTLPNQRARQKMVKAECIKAGFNRFEFFVGYDAEHQLVKKAFEENRVKSFPSCFRCGQIDCGRAECNNILIPSQVAIVLGYQSLLNRIAEGPDEIVFICEDDIVFAGYARNVLASIEVEMCLKIATENPKIPFLLRLCTPNRPQHFADSCTNEKIEITNEIVMSNPGFIVNKSFARLSVTRLAQIDHTADMIIHQHLANKADALTLRPQIVSDRSWSTGECDSLIHPKAKHLEYLTKVHGIDSEIVQHAKDRLTKHVKKAFLIEYAFIGSPRCGSHFVSKFLLSNNIQVEHEALGKDGLCTWQYAVDSDNHPYISDPRCRDNYFVYPKSYILYVRDPKNAIESLILENEQAPLSYSHRREMILQNLGIDLNIFSTREERAARSYIHWYELALKRPLHGIVRVEYLYEDLKRLRGFEMIENLPVSKRDSGAGKPYLGVIHDRIELPPNWHELLSRDTLLRLSMMSKQFGYDNR